MLFLLLICIVARLGSLEKDQSFWNLRGILKQLLGMIPFGIGWFLADIFDSSTTTEPPKIDLWIVIVVAAAAIGLIRFMTNREKIERKKFPLFAGISEFSLGFVYTVVVLLLARLF